MSKCGHTSLWFTCNKPKGHKGLHGQTVKLRGGYKETTNWGHDGLAPWATKEPENRDRP